MYLLYSTLHHPISTLRFVPLTRPAVDLSHKGRGDFIEYI